MREVWLTGRSEKRRRTWRKRQRKQKQRGTGRTTKGRKSVKVAEEWSANTESERHPRLRRRGGGGKWQASRDPQCGPGCGQAQCVSSSPDHCGLLANHPSAILVTEASGLTALPVGNSGSSSLVF